MNLIINDRSYLDNATLGKWFFNGEWICYSIELPWKNNQPSISCISAGDYIVKPISTKKHPDSFFLENHNLGVSWNGATVRTEIEIHIANFVTDIVGCLGPGLALHPTTWGVMDSTKAMEKLNNIIQPGEEWTMRIT